MKLIEWMIARKMEFNDLAHLLRVHRTHLYGVRRGKKNPSAKLMKKIVQLTQGEVMQYEDVRDEYCIGHRKQRRMNEVL